MQKKIILLAVMIIANLAYSQQKTGKFATYEDYLQGKFMDGDEYTGASSEVNEEWTNVRFQTKNGENVELLFSGLGRSGKDSCRIWNVKKRQGTDVCCQWGYYDGSRTLRICPVKDKGRYGTIVAVVIQWVAPICLYSDIIYPTKPSLDDKGELVGLHANSVYVSKTLTGELFELNKKNLAALVQDDPAMTEFVKSKKYGNLKLIYVINQYNNSHKKP